MTRERIAGILIVALLTGCSSSERTSLYPVVSQAAPQSHASACGASVIYAVSSQNRAIDVYDRVRARATPCGTITGFNTPEGLFVDSKDDVWVADAGTDKVYEFAPSGTTPMLTLDDPNGVPIAVTVDDATQTVYVIEYKNAANPQTLVEVYAGGSTSPTGALSDPNARNGAFGAVDNAGNLYVTFMTQANRAQVDEWNGGAGVPKNLGFKLISAGGIVTTKTGALAICDPYGYRCGIFEPGSNRLTHVFGHMGRHRGGGVSPDKRPWLAPQGVALDAAEQHAYVTSETLSQWTFPGPRMRPNRRPQNEMTVPGVAGSGVAASPASAPGAPYK